MKIFKQLNKKGYKHYYEGIIEELDSMDKDNQHLHSEIMQVLMWLYEKHGIWISIEPPFPKRIVLWEYYIQKSEDRTLLGQNSGYDSPTEAYKAAIEYALKNLIP